VVADNLAAGFVRNCQSFMGLKQSKERLFPDEIHQLAYIMPVLRTPDPVASTGVGDIRLNYRHQPSPRNASPSRFGCRSSRPR